MKKSIALLLTLSFLVISLSIIGTIFSFYQKFTNNSFEYSLTQDSLILKSINKKLKPIEFNNSKKIDMLLNYKLLFSNKDFSIMASFFPVFDRININNVKNENFLDLICDKYNLLDCVFFKSLILDTIDKDLDERVKYSEIALYEPFANGAIYNKKHFSKIINYYYKITQDKNIYKIPFNDIFSFDAIYTDCNHLSFSIRKLLGADNCEQLQNLYGDEFLKKLDIMPFTNKKAYYVLIDVTYSSLYGVSKLHVLYDVINKKVVKVEKHLVY